MNDTPASQPSSPSLFEWLQSEFSLSDPIVFSVAAAAVTLLVLTLLVRLWRGWADSAARSRMRAERREQLAEAERRQAELERLATRIIATSSTAVIAGFRIVRQIEAVFSDGQSSPAKAVEMLKALAAEKGANAVINLRTDRVASGRCVANGDAVIVQPIGGTAALESQPRRE
jgi:uncharacterized protein YbjQ (UPF0145 family)